VVRESATVRAVKVVFCGFGGQDPMTAAR
jgi:hypothetical protein